MKNDEDNAVFTDIVIVGAGVTGLSTAIELDNLLKKSGEKKRIMIIEKSAEVGEHILSGAIIKDEVFKNLLNDEEFENLPIISEISSDKVIRLLPDKYFAIPFHLPYMKNEGNKLVSLSQICRYLAKVAQKRGIEIYPGFAVNEIIYENDKVAGVKCKDTGIDKNGKKLKNFQEGTSVKADLVILGEGTRGTLAKKVKDKFHLREDSNPQVYSLGIKEIWNVKKGSVKKGEVYHTFGYPLKGSEFGGGFIYGLSDSKVAIGFVVGLDYEDPTLDPHGLMQIWKQHPFIKGILQGGKIEEYGAKTIPEGGWNSISKLYIDHLLITGDSAGFVAMPSLKGVHLSVVSGMCAAKTAHEAIKNSDFSEASLSSYKSYIDKSQIKKELYPLRNFRAVMSEGLLIGSMKFGVQLLTKGFCMLTPKLKKDSLCTKKLTDFKDTPFHERFEDKLHFDKIITFDKDSSIYYSGTSHDENQPCHLIVKDIKLFKKSNIKEYGMPSQYFCPAGVYEEYIDKDKNRALKIHAENCVHCKSCDIKTPNDVITWDTPYGGDGPKYQNM